jgi:hypothetical protein
MSKATFNIKKALFTSKLDLKFGKKLVSATFGPQPSMVLKPGHFRKQIRNTWKVLKRGAAEGWRRSVRQTELERKKYYKESRRTGISLLTYLLHAAESFLRS